VLKARSQREVSSMRPQQAAVPLLLQEDAQLELQPQSPSALPAERPQDASR
jgi:hypothetical protein